MRIDLLSLLITLVSKKLVWKRGDGWVQYDPPRKSEQWSEWQKLKQKELEKENGRTK
jgi:hypothetical protein